MLLRLAGLLRVFTKVLGMFPLAIGVEFILRGLSTVYRQLSLAAPMGCAPGRRQCGGRRQSH